MHHFLRWLSAAALFFTTFLFSVVISSGIEGTSSLRGFLPARVEAERALEQKLRAIPDTAHAEANLRHLTSEPHMAGTEASHRVAQWLEEQFRSFGFDAEIVSYSVWLPQPREVKLELPVPESKTLATPEQPYEVDKDTFDPRVVVGFNAFSPSADVTAPVVYVNYGAPEDYRELDSRGISVEGKIAIARYGHNYRGIKTKLAEEHKAAGLIIYSDPQDDGYVAGDPFPRGPWRPMSGIQRGSVLYTQLYPGDPLTPGIAATPDAKRLAPADAANVSQIPTLPINAQDAAVILQNLAGPPVPKAWQGGLPFTYHLGPGDATAHIKLVMDYQQRQIYDVIARLRGTDDSQWVVMGNHHDAWVFGAADPGSGTAVMLETARSLGELARNGWKPRRTIVMCEWDGEEPGLIGSTEWVEANRAELQARAVAYINTDVGVIGPNFSASATPSLEELVRDAARDVQDPHSTSHRSVYDVWQERAAHPKDEVSGTARPEPKSEPSGDVSLSALGAGSDFCPFLDHAGIPSMDMGFAGDYGVYHALYDDFYWMKHFGDPTFAYHAALARIIGTIALRLDEADVLPYDFTAYASEIARASADLASHAAQPGGDAAVAKVVSGASAQLTAAASRAAQALQSLTASSLSPTKEAELNHSLAAVEQSLLSPEGLMGRPWYKHTIYAPGIHAGYAAEIFPGPNEALERKDRAAFRHEAEALAAALRRAAASLDEIARLAQP
ncbi:MAG TPA: M28 family metallopeptidase [Candidatus Limnocylindria bacterium]|nr:M28 family metallopeptidase [Candidatus Limnocylindria bacterium]